MKGKGKVKKSVKKSDLEVALIKKALGYDATEVVEEYAGGEEGEIKLLKKKVTTKYVPPDTTALKLLLDESEMDVAKMSDEELETEKNRLLKLLKEMSKGETS
ncbi:MAG: hypothetical protein IJV95_02865 [Clostridia bacterium]|nr:hypothetical protein [Clostridia bacterium]